MTNESVVIGIYVIGLFLFLCNGTGHGKIIGKTVTLEQNVINPPLSPEQMNMEKDNAIAWMNTATQVIDVNSESVYYVKIYITNEQCFQLLKEHQVYYSMLPISCLESDASLMAYENVSGLINTSDYTNTYAVYALITALHYNYYLQTKAQIFMPVRLVPVLELATNYFNTNFIVTSVYENPVVNINNKKSIQTRGMVEDFLRSIIRAWGFISDAVGRATTSAGIMINGECDVKGYLYYSGTNANSGFYYTKPLPYVKLRYHIGLGSRSYTVDSNGQFQFRVAKNTKGTMEIELSSIYGWFTDNFLVPKYAVVPDYQVGANDHLVQNIHLDCIPEAFILGTLYDSYLFAKNENILNGDLPRIRAIIKVDTNGAAGYGWPALFYWNDPTNAFISTETIQITSTNNAFDLATIFHEYGHVLHNYGAVRNGVNMLSLSIGYITDLVFNKIVYPDGVTNKLYSKNNFSLVTEGWADFYSMACRLNYINEYHDDKVLKVFNQYENNFGSREVLFASVLSNANGIGKYNNKYLYEYCFYKEKFRSILVDLYDDNRFISSNSLYNFDNQQISLYELHSAHFYDITNKEYYTDFYNFKSNYSFNTISNRETINDRVSISVRNIFDLVCQNSVMQDYKSGLMSSYGIVNVTHNEMQSLLLMHDSNIPFYTPDLEKPTIFITGPNEGQNVSTNIFITASIRDSYSGLSYNSTYIRIYLSNSTSAITTEYLYSNYQDGTIDPVYLFKAIEVSQPGVYYFWIRAQDRRYNTNITAPRRVVVCDNVPLLFISNNFTNGINETNQLNVTLSGSTAVLNNTVTAVKVVVNGITNTASGTANWSYTAALRDIYTNTIQIYAQSAAGVDSQVKTVNLFADNAVYVRTNGNDTWAGTRWAPVKTLTNAVVLAAARGVPNIRVAGGYYTSLMTYNGISYIDLGNLNLYGSYDYNFTVQNISYFKTTIDGLTTTPIIIRYGKFINSVELKNSDVAIFSGHGAIISNVIITDIDSFNGNFEKGGIYIESYGGSVNIFESLFKNISTSAVQSFAYTGFYISNCTFSNIVGIAVNEGDSGRLFDNKYYLCEKLYSDGISNQFIYPGFVPGLGVITSVNILNSLDEMGYNPPNSMHGNIKVY